VLLHRNLELGEGLDEGRVEADLVAYAITSASAAKARPARPAASRTSSQRSACSW